MEYAVKKIQKVSRYCFICGTEQDASLKSRFFEIERDGRETLVCVPSVKFIHQSYPGRMHGGVIGALLDETIGRAVQIGGDTLWGVTAELTVRYLKPVALDEEIFVLGHITKSNRLIFEGEGQIISAAAGRLLASAHGKYVRLDPLKITDKPDFLHSDWFDDPRPAVKKIILPV